jgi:glycosyltransferase involved in cell wall biosynthesis
VPCYNEAGSIATLIDHLHRRLSGFDIVVIDDGSIDDSAAQVPETATLIRLPFNLGIGGAMQTGYRYAAANGYDVAIQVDGDGQHRPIDVRRLIEHMDATGADMVIGSRFLGGKRYRQTAARAAGAGVLRAIIRTLTGLTITDCTSGFRAANRRVIEAFAHWYPDDYPEPEVVLLLNRAGFTIAETPVRMKRRAAGVSSIRLLNGVFYVVKVSTALLLDLFRDPWPHVKRGGR